MMNKQTVTRRSFLATAGAGLAAGPAIAFASNNKTKNVIACRDAHLRDVPAPDTWAAAKTIGAEGMEIWVNKDLTLPYLFPKERYSIKTADDIAALGEAVKKNGLKITAFAMPNRFDEFPEEETAWCAKVVDAAKQLNVNAIRIDVVPRKIQGEAFLDFAIKICKRIVELVKGTDIRYGIENHGNTTNDPEFLNNLFAGVGSDALGLTLDTANFYWFGHPLDSLYKIFETFASRAVHTHCKSIKYPAEKRNVQRPRGWEYGKYCSPIHMGDIDFKRVASILRAVNYQGDFCVEDESLGRFPKEEREGLLKQEIALLRNLG